jgi:hypothetical protein
MDTSPAYVRTQVKPQFGQGFGHSLSPCLDTCLSTAQFFTVKIQFARYGCGEAGFGLQAGKSVFQKALLIRFGFGFLALQVRGGVGDRGRFVMRLDVAPRNVSSFLVG